MHGIATELAAGYIRILRIAPRMLNHVNLPVLVALFLLYQKSDPAVQHAAVFSGRLE